MYDFEVLTHRADWLSPRLLTAGYPQATRSLPDRYRPAALLGTTVARAPLVSTRVAWVCAL
jgi:hypothetical protein